MYHGGDGRTKMKPLRYEKRDFIAYIILLAYMVICITLGNLEILSIDSMIAFFKG